MGRTIKTPTLTRLLRRALRQRCGRIRKALMMSRTCESDPARSAPRPGGSTYEQLASLPPLAHLRWFTTMWLELAPTSIQDIAPGSATCHYSPGKWDLVMEMTAAHLGSVSPPHRCQQTSQGLQPTAYSSVYMISLDTYTHTHTCTHMHALVHTRVRTRAHTRTYTFNQTKVFNCILKC